jgi:hypothetical protein
MKIVDIVSESTNEGLGNVLAKAGAWMVGKGSRAQALKKLSDEIASLRRGTKLSADEIEALVGKELAADARFVADAEKMAAKKIADAAYAANVAAIRASLANVGSWVEKLKNVYLVSMFVGPLMTYYNNMQAAQKLLDSGQETAQDFELYHRREVSVLIGKWTSLIVANWAGKVAGNWMGKFFSMFGMNKTRAFFTNIVGKGLGVAAVWAVSDKEVAQYIANFMASAILRDSVGYLGVKGEDALLGMISDKLKYGPQGTATDAGQGGKPTSSSTTPAQDIGASSQPPSGSGNTTANKPASEFDRPLFKDFK